MPGPSFKAKTWPTCSGHRLAVGHRGQIGQPHPVGIIGEDLGPRVNGQAGLAAPPRADQRDQRRLPQQLLDLGQLDLAAHEAGALDGQIVSPGIQRPQRRELGSQVGVAELEDPLGAGQVREPVDAQIPERAPSGRASTASSAAAWDSTVWPPWARVTDPGRPIDRRAGVVALIPAQHVPGMHTDPQLQRSARQSLLDGQSAGHPVTGPGEGGHETVPLTLLHGAHPVMASHLLVDHRVQGGQLLGHGLGVGLPGPGGALHVAQAPTSPSPSATRSSPRPWTALPTATAGPTPEDPQSRS